MMLAHKKEYTMKALSIQQPWAWAILHAGKDIENRSWPTNFRGRILIHAGQKLDLNGIDFLLDRKLDVPLCPEMGGIVGSVEIADCVEHSNSSWFFGKYGFVLKNPLVLPFMPCPGRLKFFTVEYNMQVVG